MARKSHRKNPFAACTDEELAAALAAAATDYLRHSAELLKCAFRFDHAIREVRARAETNASIVSLYGEGIAGE